MLKDAQLEMKSTQMLNQAILVNELLRRENKLLRKLGLNMMRNSKFLFHLIA
ncbi:hypothetical protein GCM10017161_08460 [Thalassotalea marina]|uniref:Uncharacterized protein n=1 Tax=Thalassotalea marina TaxID=1673741 RepID=A0A919BEK9_9GAMM|nr:hypothetical protein GCM10017161_08460 [Thalassotalea marina]